MDGGIYVIVLHYVQVKDPRFRKLRMNFAGKGNFVATYEETAPQFTCPTIAQ